MTDSKGQKLTVTLEPGQVAIILGMEGQEIVRQLLVTPEVDAMMDDDEADIPFNFFLASAFLMRLDRDETFGNELADWYDEFLRSESNDARSDD